ncbi:MAG TPA: ATP-binding protein [bacterium]|nr:ATP-binding protein [bacterium]
MIPRQYDDLERYLQPGKVLVIYGPRQVGKTTLIQEYLQRTAWKHRFASGEDARLRELFAAERLDLFLEYAAGHELIVIDEAQKVPGIGLGLKMLIDAMPALRIIATGSSSFELAGQVGEPLTGRKRTLTLYPVAQMELSRMHNRFDLREKLEDSIVFGAYPEVVSASSREEKSRILHELADSYLLRDVLALDNIKNSRTIFDLLRLLALQIGGEVSLSEIGTQIGINYKTVARYIDILEKSFILYRLPGMGKNPRTDLRKKSKYFFFDTGIRNALISNLNPPALRDDAGRLWENFLCVERMKRQAYHEQFANFYFWRTNAQKEIDLIEERDGKLFGFEFKWGTKEPKPPKEWKEFGPDASYTVISRENYLDFVL